MNRKHQGRHKLSNATHKSKDIGEIFGKVLPFKADTSAFLRQPKESEQAYEAWNLYKDFKYQGTGGQREVCIALGKSRALIERWSMRWKWKERYRLYQNAKHLEEEALRRREAEARARKWASRRIDTREAGFDVGKLLIERGRSLLSLPTFNKTVPKKIEVTSEMVGQTIDTLTVLEFREHPRDGRMYVEAGIKLQRLSADMSTENLNINPEDIERDLDSMSEEELLEYAAKLDEIRQQELAAGNV
jgi:hypothetical protein